MPERRKKMIVGGFIAFIMVASVFVVTLDFLFTPTNNLTYNGVKFAVAQNQFTARINQKQYRFLVYPADLEDLNLSQAGKDLLKAAVLTITYDPQSGMAQDLATAQYYLEDQLKDVKVIDRAVLNNTGLSLAQESCANATSSQPVIELLEAQSSGIAVEGNCIRLAAIDGQDLLKMSERVIYQVLGVMT